MLKESIKKYLENYEDKSNIIKIWYVKEYLQTHILKQIYNFDDTKNLIFYWWTSLRFLYNLNRLSEDLDFVSKDFNDYEKLASFLVKYFEQFNIKIDYKIQKFRIILKFRNFLDDFDLSFWNSSDLYIKIEISDYIDFCDNYEVKIIPVFKNNLSILIKTFDKNTLFSTKINAVLHRKWEKKDWKNLLKIKWRDIYDLFWYLSNNFKPNIDCIIWVRDINDLKEKLKWIINNISFLEVIWDIKNFLEDDELLVFFESPDIKKFLLEKIDEL